MYQRIYTNHNNQYLDKKTGIRFCFVAKKYIMHDNLCFHDLKITTIFIDKMQSQLCT